MKQRLNVVGPLGVKGPGQNFYHEYEVHDYNCRELSVLPHLREAFDEEATWDVRFKAELIQIVFSDQISEDPALTVDDFAGEMFFAPCVMIPYEKER